MAFFTDLGTAEEAGGKVYATWKAPRNHRYKIKFQLLEADTIYGQPSSAVVQVHENFNWENHGICTVSDNNNPVQHIIAADHDVHDDEWRVRMEYVFNGKKEYAAVRRNPEFIAGNPNGIFVDFEIEARTRGHFEIHWQPG